MEQDAVVLWAIQQVEYLGLRHIAITEAGACALRIVERGRNKGTAIIQVGYDPARLVFCGDSANDLHIAALIPIGYHSHREHRGRRDDTRECAAVALVIPVLVDCCFAGTFR